MTLLEQVTARAFLQAEASEANEAIAEARTLRGQGGREALSYEVVVPALDPDGFLTQRALPRLVYFLDCRGLQLTRTPGVFVSLFTPAGLWFIDAGEVVEVLAAARGLSADELRRRYGQAGVGDPPLLGT